MSSTSITGAVASKTSVTPASPASRPFGVLWMPPSRLQVREGDGVITLSHLRHGLARFTVFLVLFFIGLFAWPLYRSPTFLGFANYQELFADPIFYTVLPSQPNAPLSMLAVFSFIGYSYLYLRPLVIINSKELDTVVPFEFFIFTGEHGTQWRLMVAASTLAIIPLLITVAVLQRQAIKGVALDCFGGR